MYTPHMTGLYSRAMQLAASGLSIMPVGLDKRPLLKSWKQYQTKRPTDEEIEAWWEKWPKANIGVITGKVSGITVIDVDTYKGGKADRFPKTYTVQTGNGGLHLYYKYAPGLTISANAYADMPGIDIRNDGGYVVGPYSETNYSDLHTHEHRGGAYTVVSSIEMAPFPSALFPQVKTKRKVGDLVGVGAGGRNDSITSMIGKLLKQCRDEKEWETEVWPAIQRINKTYMPPLLEDELRATFESIKTKEQVQRGNLIVSPLQLDNGEEVRLRKSQSNVAYKDMSNVLIVLEEHPFYKGTFKYNEFRHEIEYNGKPLEESDLFKIQQFMQTKANLYGVTKDAIYSAVHHYAYQNSYDEAMDWVKGLHWDGTPRLHEWLAKAVRVEADPYHAGIGAQWFLGLVKRIMQPGCTFDYVLVFVGKQGIGKTSLFRIIGGPWYKSYTGAIENKDFYLALRGAAIVDLDEGAALNKSEAIKIKSVITETHDEYRAPYDRLMKKYPRRFVFSMSTNDTEPFRDITGNRRYWVVASDSRVDFEWLTENRDQLYAEAYHALVNNVELPQVDFIRAAEIQEYHLPEDSWTDIVRTHLEKSSAYRDGDPQFNTTIIDTYAQVFPEASLDRMGKSQEMRIGGIFRKLGLVKRRIMVEGSQKTIWVLSSDEIAKRRAKPLEDKRDDIEKEFDDK